MSIDTNYRNSSRRHFLRGVGVALALPWMESLPIFAQSAAPAAGAAAAGTPPLRLGIVFFSNGVEPAHWWAKGAGASMEIGPALTPMMPHREDMLFINGLFNQSALASTSPHLGRMNVLSGATVSLDPKEIRVGAAGGPPAWSVGTVLQELDDAAGAEVDIDGRSVVDAMTAIQQAPYRALGG